MVGLVLTGFTFLETKCQSQQFPGPEPLRPVTIVSGILVVSLLSLLVEMIEVLVALIFAGGVFPVPEVPPV